jgi:hypothetical protein
MSNAFAVEYKGWQYISDKSKPANQSVKIVPPEGIVQPESLYKYYGLSKFSLDALKNCYIYASCPFELNDPFDSMNPLIDYQNVSDDILFEFYSSVGETHEVIVENLDDFKTRFPKDFAIVIYTGMGIISLTSDGTNPLMWAHYASSHEGFTVKFKETKLKGNHQLVGPFPINYQDEWKPFDFNISPPIAFLYQANIKGSNWEYEKEWRYVAIGKEMSIPDIRDSKEYIQNRHMGYPIDAIEEIILGFKFIKGLVKQDCKNNICELRFEDTKEFNAKRELLNFICDKNILTSKIHLKNGSIAFELETKPVVIERITPYLFVMKL